MPDMTEKQKSYARYLIKKSADERSWILATMKPSLRIKMRRYMRAQLVAELPNWNDTVRAMFLRNLKRTNVMEFTALMEAMPKKLADQCRHEMTLH